MWADGADTVKVRELEQKVQLMDQWGYRIDVVSAQQVTREIERDLVIDADRVVNVYVASQEGWLETANFCHGLIHCASHRHGVEVLAGEVRGFEQRNGAIDATRLADGTTLYSDVVVNCAGPEASEVAHLAGLRLPLGLRPGALMITGATPNRLRHVVHSPHVNMRPDNAGRLALNLHSVDAFIARGGYLNVGDQTTRDAISTAATMMPALRNTMVESWRAGVRPVPLDGLPIIGFDPRLRGLYHAVTHSAVTLAAILGRLVAEELSGRESPDLTRYRADRLIAA